MEILLASKRLPGAKGRRDGGVQTWIRTVAKELERLGHKVRLGNPKGTYDLGIIANIRYTRPVLNFCRKSILVSHGIVKDERPEAGCDVTAYVSEGVRDHWEGQGPIIRQPIDLEFWKPSDAPRTRLVRYGYRTTPMHAERVAERLGLEYRPVHRASHERAREFLQSAACVLATGRAALEAMACGAPTVIYDHRAYQGPLLGLDMAVNMANSYSGRGGFEPTESDVVDACRKEMQLGSPRRWVEQHHDARKVVEGMLCLAS